MQELDLQNPNLWKMYRGPERNQPFLLYYESSYAYPLNPCKSVEGLEWDGLLSDKVVWLERYFEEDEIHSFIMDMDNVNASGLDGFTIAFFKNCWDVIKNQLILVFNEFHERGIINTSMNSTFIVRLTLPFLLKGHLLRIDKFWMKS